MSARRHARGDPAALAGAARAARRRAYAPYSRFPVGAALLAADGAIVGSAASRPAYAYPAYRPVPGYVVYDGYYRAYPVSCPGGYWARKPVAFDRAGRPVAWSKPRFICPAY